MNERPIDTLSRRLAELATTSRAEASVAGMAGDPEACCQLAAMAEAFGLAARMADRAALGLAPEEAPQSYGARP